MTKNESSATSALELPPRLEEVGAAVAWARARVADWVDQNALDAGLTEALTNAIVHGALEVSSEHREADIETYLNEAVRRARAPQARHAAIWLTLTQSDAHVEFGLRWKGAACPVDKQAPASTSDPLAGAGRGTRLIHESFDAVQWGEDGTSMRLLLYRDARKPKLGL